MRDPREWQVKEEMGYPRMALLTKECQKALRGGGTRYNTMSLKKIRLLFLPLNSPGKMRGKKMSEGESEKNIERGRSKMEEKKRKINESLS